MIGARSLPAQKRPGSFSKNYGFEIYGTGFEKLRQAIQLGFDGQPSDVLREKFRERHSALKGPELIPINFFLFNRRTAAGDYLVVDELVVNALGTSAKAQFDSLAFVAFHLNSVGTWTGADPWQSRPASWAALFVEQKLDPAAVWSNPTKAEIETFFESVMQFGADSPTKFATNYAAFFRYGGYFGSRPDERKRRFVQYGASATYLLLDRQVLAEGKSATDCDHEDFKYLARVMGVEHAWARDYFERWLQAYDRAGGLGRISANISPLSGPSSGTTEADKAVLIGRDADVEYGIVQGLKRKRDNAIAASLKQHYGFLCQVCSVPVYADENKRLYCEAGHVRPLGKPHVGPDNVRNLLALCPNHHIQLDRGVMTLATDGGALTTVSTYPELAGKSVALKPPHAIDPDHISYHRTVIYRQAS